MRRAQQRGANVDELQNRTDALATQANTFKSGANRVRKQMWWKDMKMRMCIIVGIILLLVVIIVPSGEFSVTHCDILRLPGGRRSGKGPMADHGVRF